VVFSFIGIIAEDTGLDISEAIQESNLEEIFAIKFCKEILLFF
jgi:hypothetical protein